ncbi:hypothetical protein BAE44_0006172 [Dichanthelium oligosanthes]|uniref:GST N-terminal domain-containing protein n=1 Tax=Dichanthelium oligosanthes TaxID=888268 RepID=A0A1E5W5W7_9POAL|nr:hypothetical protein BAE44_0006172 [Dichanthelium oligosanthes]
MPQTCAPRCLPWRLEHNNEIMGESLDLIKYIDSNFGGPALLPEDPAKREFADAFTKALYSPLMSHVEMSEEAGKSIDEAGGFSSYFAYSASSSSLPPASSPEVSGDLVDKLGNLAMADPISSQVVNVESEQVSGPPETHLPGVNFGLREDYSSGV